MKNKDLVSLPRKVEITWLIPKVGFHKEIYDLGYAEHLIAWSCNERLSCAYCSNIKVIEEKIVPYSMFKHVQRSRAGMKCYIDQCIMEARQRITRGVASGS